MEGNPCVAEFRTPDSGNSKSDTGLQIVGDRGGEVMGWRLSHSRLVIVDFPKELSSKACHIPSRAALQAILAGYLNRSKQRKQSWAWSGAVSSLCSLCYLLFKQSGMDGPSGSVKRSSIKNENPGRVDDYGDDYEKRVGPSQASTVVVAVVVYRKNGKRGRRLESR